MSLAFTRFKETVNPDFCRNYLLDYQADSYADRKRIADLLLTNTFLFEDNWDMEPCHIPYHLDPITWQEAVTDDPEWNFMLNRQTYLQTLILVYLVERDERYLLKAKSFILNWIESAIPLDPKGLATRTLDTGIRCFAWVKCLIYLNLFNALTKQEESLILASLEKQLHFLHANYLDKYSLSNWGILQTTAILLADAYFGSNLDIAAATAFARKELTQQIALQILEDGSQFEQSTMYHVEVLKALLELTALVPDYLPQLRPTLLAMSDYLLKMTGPDHKQIPLGDSDFTDTRDILTLAATILEEPHLKAAAFPTLDIDSLLLLGEKGVHTFEQLPVQTLPTFAHHFEHSGHITINQENYYLFFKNGPIGSSHTHSDQNSICLYYKGQPLFCDAGRYTYKEEPLRYALKSASHHSTAFLEEQLPEQINSSWAYLSYPKSNYCHLRQNGHVYFIEGSYQTQFSDRNNYQHDRQILILPPGMFLIIDTIQAQGNHCLVSQFILDNHLEVKTDHLSDLRLISDCPFTIEETILSKKYNQYLTSHKFIKRKPFKDKGCTSTLLVPDDTKVTPLTPLQTGKRNPIETALSWHLKGKQFDYSICVLQEDLIKGEKLVLLNGHKTRGKVVVINHITNEIIRLKH
ncbi:oligohyaluronate lyase [Streptococcus pyogenes]|uniref:heparinase II/III domain-containing protein n=1 Tax=Streptococcus pyogenes TaxID=1314 RepID=UPI00109C2511|nr:heparinase II/III family protein [Streptococcus pyogenes]VGT01306.1 oligohyaluronate lyase [Streptococcus pyogenes]VGU70732.1 oligohyaluronate lyase [Streptococcus pyogenes]VHI63064.1 oligohyaluronate lyase [Streptococcus pyogenes]